MFPRIRTCFMVPTLATAVLLCSMAGAETFDDRAREFAGPNARVVNHTVTHPTQPGLSRAISRTFVPILPGQEQAFVDKFCTGRSCVLMARPSAHQAYPYHKYTRVIAKGTDGVLAAWSSTEESGPMNVGPNAARFIQHQDGARYVVANLGVAGLSAAVTFLRSFRTREVLGGTTHGQPFNNEYYGIGQYRAAKVAAGQPVGDTSAQCMWWLPNLETGEGKTLTQSFGCKRTRGPQEVAALAHHGATSESVPVIGVAVPNLETFHQLTEEQLRGPRPTNGDYGSWIR